MTRRSAGFGSATAGILVHETQSRFLVGWLAEKTAELNEIPTRHGVPHSVLGTVGGDRITPGGVLDVSLNDAMAAPEAALRR